MQPRRSGTKLSTVDMIEGVSSPELLPPEHGRLLEPRDWAMAQGSDEGGSGCGSSGVRKGNALELDGEWFGDAVPAQESPAMALLLSIANAAADAVPGLARSSCESTSHLPLSRNRAWRDRRPVFSSHSTGRSSALSSPSHPGEFYRLSWYRRPLRTPRAPPPPPPPPPPPRNSSMSGDALTFSRRGRTSFPLLNAGGDSDRSTAVTPIITPTPVDSNIEAEDEQEDEDECHVLRVSGVSTPRFRDSLGEDQGTAPVSLTVEAAPTPDRPRSPAKEERADLHSGLGLPMAPTEEAPTAPKSSSNTVSPNGNADSSDDGDSPRDRVRELKAEVERLKREMAAMSAAAGKMGVVPGAHASSCGAPKSPRAAPTGLIPWQWTSIDGTISAGGGAAGGQGPQSSMAAAAAAALANATRPKSVRLRADDSWMQRRFSGEMNDGTCGKNTSSTSSSLDRNDGLQTRVRSSTLPQSPASTFDGDNGSRGSSQTPQPGRRRKDHNGRLVTLEISPPSRNRRSSLGVGPSPASGEKTIGGSNGGNGNNGSATGTAVSAARVLDADEAEGAAGDEGGGRDGDSSGSRGADSKGSNGSGHQDITVRPFPVFFPPGGAREGAERSAGGGTAGGSGDNRTSLATELAAAAAAEGTMGEGRSSSGGMEGPRKGGGRSRRRRLSAEDDGQIWRWVLAQRTENPTVRQAIISHGLPANSRRKIWAAWAAVARPASTTSSAVFDRRKSTLDPKLGSVENIISHDVQRTKIQHPLFTGEAPQGIPILKRVLLLCAELGAVRDAGYIQGMNFLGGFLIITFAESVVAEREDSTNKKSNNTTNDLEETSKADGGGVTAMASKHGSHGGRSGAQDRPRGRDTFREVELTAEEVELVETECVQVMLGLVSLQGGVLSRDLYGLHANTELVEDLLSKHCPPIMDHLRSLSLELIVLTPRWFICIYAASIASQTVVARIWDLFLWHGRRGPAVLVWVALGVLHGCRRRLLECESLSSAVNAVRRYVEGCKTFTDLVRQAPVGLNQVVAAWEGHRNNRRIVALDGEGPIPDAVVGGLVQEMTGEMVINLPPPPDAAISPRRNLDRGYGASSTFGSGMGGHFPSTPGRLPTPLTSPRSPFPQWAANIFRSSTGGLGDDALGAVERGREGHRDGTLRHGSPRAHATPSKWADGSMQPSGGGRGYRRASSTSWW